MPGGLRLELRRVAKRFGPLRVLAGVDLDLRGGEVHALLGENGAGKSTLMNVVYGLVQADGGEIRLDGRAIRPRDPAAARRLGIGMVHQHFTVVGRLTTAENFALSLAGSGLGFRPPEAAAAAAELAARFGLDIGDAAAPSEELSVGARQRLEILKALAGDARILILDEPTAVLTPSEVAQLFGVLERLRSEGRLVVFITHKLQEVRAIADRVSILRRGVVVSEGRPADLRDDEIARLMVGDASPPAPSERRIGADELLRLEGVALAAAAPAIDLAVHAGEILGVVGVDGNGQAELFEILAGLRAPARGQVRLAGELPAAVSVAALQEAGVGVIPPDRRGDGLVADMTVRDNLLLNRKLLRALSRHGVLDRRRIDDFALEQARRYRVRDSALAAAAGTLSGGNQQRIVVARALASEPRILVAVNPTRGLDIGAAQAVYEALDRFVAAGGAVVLISTDLDEAMAMSDRIAVLYRHRLSPRLTPPYSLERIGLLMAGSPAGDAA